MKNQKKAPALGRGFSKSGAGSDRLNLVSLHAFLALDCFEGDLLAFFQALEAVAFDSAEVNEEIRTAFWGDEAVTFFVIEPLDGTLLTLSHCLISYET
ncbi:hypothetical protein METHP14_230001 [Pseudomonas sp. P14-2025]